MILKITQQVNLPNTMTSNYEKIISISEIDFFGNSTSKGVCFVAPVLKSSCTICTFWFSAPYAPRIRSLAASFRRSLIKHTKVMFPDLIRLPIKQKLDMHDDQSHLNDFNIVLDIKKLVLKETLGYVSASIMVILLLIFQFALYDYNIEEYTSFFV